MASHLYTLPPDAVWFVTGCSSGIGLGLAQLIAAHPTNRLVATARTPSKLAGLVKESDKVLILALDVTSEEAIDAAVASAVARFGRIDVMVNNAGYGLIGDTESMLEPEGLAKARKVIETDLWGTMRLTVQAVRVFREENPRNGQQGGVVLNVTSLGGFAGYPGTAFYHAAKFGVEGFTESIGKEVRPEWNTHFCIIEPGGTRTNFSEAGAMDWLPRHPAYAAEDNSTRIMEKYVVDPAMVQTRTPADRVAKAMYEVVARADTHPIPVRLPLTRGAWDVVKGKVADIEKELDEVKELSFSVEVDDKNNVGDYLRNTFSK